MSLNINEKELLTHESYSSSEKIKLDYDKIVIELLEKSDIKVTFKQFVSLIQETTKELPIEITIRNNLNKLFNGKKSVQVTRKGKVISFVLRKAKVKVKTQFNKTKKRQSVYFTTIER